MNEESNTPDVIDSSIDSSEIDQDPQTLHAALRNSQPDLELTSPIPEEGKWYIDATIEGEGLKPDYFHHKTFKTVVDQAKAYSKARKRIDELSNELKKHGAAPEQYEEKLPESLKDFEVGQEIIEKNLPVLKKWAKENNLSNKAFNGALEFFINHLKNQHEQDGAALVEYNKKELFKIDENQDEANRKLKRLATWIKQSFPELDDGILKEMMTSHAAYHVMNHIREVTPVNQAPTDVPVTQFEEKEQLQKMMTDPRYARDLIYTHHVDRKWKEWGNRHGMAN